MIIAKQNQKEALPMNIILYLFDRLVGYMYEKLSDFGDTDLVYNVKKDTAKLLHTASYCVKI